MTYREKVDWLFRYQDGLKRQHELEQEAAQLRALAEGVSQNITGMPGTHQASDRMPGAVEQLIEAHDALRSQINACMQARAEVLDALAQVHDPRRRELLRRRYILGQRFERIAAEMHFDTRWVRRLHKQTIDTMQIEKGVQNDGDQNQKGPAL